MPVESVTYSPPSPLLPKLLLPNPTIHSHSSTPQHSLHLHPTIILHFVVLYFIYFHILIICLLGNVSTTLKTMAETVLPTSIPRDDPEEDPRDNLKDASTVDEKEKPEDDSTPEQSSGEDFEEPDPEPKAVQETFEALELPTGDEQAKEDNLTQAESETLVDNLLEGLEGLADSGSHTEQILDTDPEPKAVQEILEGLELPTGNEQAKEDNSTQAESEALGLVDNL
jgi:hypothetical protein